MVDGGKRVIQEGKSSIPGDDAEDEVESSGL